MKKFLILLLSLSLLLCLCACDKDQTPTDPADTKASDATDATDESTEATVDDSKVTYTVTVTDEQGNPISGAMVKICKDSCLPAQLDANGTASWPMVEDDYYIGFVSLPAGYTYTTEETEFYFADGETSMTIVLKAVEE